MDSFAFAANQLDRAAHKRQDPAFLAAALKNPTTGLVIFSGGHCLVHDTVPWRLRYLNPAQLVELGTTSRPPVFLGLDAGRALFAIEIDPGQRDGIDQPHFVELWRNATRLPEAEAAIVAYAKGMLEWHARHRYCGRSGEANIVTRGGHQLIGGEDNAQFPRVDPAIIVLVHRGDECLLGRQASWPENQYATIAGFVEPGESLEDAVRREVKEETNVDVGEVKYLASQPWPFPTSLMVGFHALAENGSQIALNDQELADARWFSREEIAANSVRIPPTMSIAFHLIATWFDQADGPALRDLTANQRWG